MRYQRRPVPVTSYLVDGAPEGGDNALAVIAEPGPDREETHSDSGERSQRVLGRHATSASVLILAHNASGTGQKMAIAFAGDPTPPGTISGFAVKGKA